MPLGAPTPLRAKHRVEADEEAFGGLSDEEWSAPAAPVQPAWLDSDGLLSFYRTYKPEYATPERCAEILARYEGREHILATSLYKKYGPSLVSADARAAARDRKPSAKAPLRDVDGNAAATTFRGAAKKVRSPSPNPFVDNDTQTTPARPLASPAVAVAVAYEGPSLAAAIRSLAAMSPKPKPVSTPAKPSLLLQTAPRPPAATPAPPPRKRRGALVGVALALAAGAFAAHPRQNGCPAAPAAPACAACPASRPIRPEPEIVEVRLTAPEAALIADAAEADAPERDDSNALVVAVTPEEPREAPTATAPARRRARLGRGLVSHSVTLAVGAAVPQLAVAGRAVAYCRGVALSANALHAPRLARVLAILGPALRRARGLLRAALHYP